MYDVQRNWKYDGSKQRGAQFGYTDQVIESMLILKEIFPLPNRGIEGFVRSLFELIKINLSVPDHTTLSTRGKHLTGTIYADIIQQFGYFREITIRTIQYLHPVHKNSSIKAVINYG